MVSFVYSIGLELGDYVYLIQDLFFSLFLGLCVADSGPAAQLSMKVPPTSLFSPGLLLKLIAQLVLFPVFQQLTLVLLQQQQWYTKFDAGDSPLKESYASEASALNIVALGQLMIASTVATVGHPFRQPWYTSTLHRGVLLIHSCWLAYLLFAPHSEFMQIIDNKPAPRNFQLMLLGLLVCNALLSGIAAKIVDLFF